MSGRDYPGKNRWIAIALALALGIVGGNRFYLGEPKKGALYLAFSWTLLPMFLGFYDAFEYATNPEWFDDSTPTASHDEILSALGVNGTVTLYDDRLEISREDIGVLHKALQGRKGDKEIPYDHITSIQLRKPSNFSRGYIQFGQSGFSESDDGLLDAISDENTVLFNKDDLAKFEELRAKVRELKNGDVEESTGTMDGAMETLRERYAKGAIDEEEYETRKEILQQD